MIEIIFVFFTIILLVSIIWKHTDSYERSSSTAISEKPADRLRDSKDHFFFDGENEYYREALLRVKGNGG